MRPHTRFGKSPYNTSSGGSYNRWHIITLLNVAPVARA